LPLQKGDVLKTSEYVNSPTVAPGSSSVIFVGVFGFFSVKETKNKKLPEIMYTYFLLLPLFLIVGLRATKNSVRRRQYTRSLLL
jgi:hypothetical protein